MKLLRSIALITILGTFIVSCNKKNNDNQSQQRIVSLNGAITETIVALGLQNQIVGVDVTSTFPLDIKETAQDLGHVSKISIETLIDLQPTLVLASSKDVNDQLSEKIRQAKIELKIIEHEHSRDGAKKLIKDVAEVLENTDYTSVIEKIDQDFTNWLRLETKPKVLFVYARGAGTMMVAGKNTPMAKIIEIAGGENAANDFEDFKPFTPEALVKINPDYILLFTSGLQSLGGVEGMLQIPGVSETNAGKNRKIIDMDGGLISSFGPRVGQAASKLNFLLSELAESEKQE